MGEENMNPAGLGGKLYFCRKEDFEKDQNTPMQEVELESVNIGDIVMFEDGAQECGGGYNGRKGFTLEGMGKVSPEADFWSRWLCSDSPNQVCLLISPDVRRLPRKIKKGSRVKYQRNTKWKRKAASWLARNQIELAGNLCIKEEELVFKGRKINNLRNLWNLCEKKNL